MAAEVRSAQSHVYYRFSSSKDFDFVRFDGEFISVGELKYLISKKTGVWKDRTTVIELFEPRTEEEYKQNNRMIRKNASVVAKRSPAVRAPPIAMQAPSERAPVSKPGGAKLPKTAPAGGSSLAVPQPSAAVTAPNNKSPPAGTLGAKQSTAGDEEEDPFGPDAYAPAPVQEAEADEDLSFQQLTKGFKQSWQVEMSHRGGHSGGGSGRGAGRGAAPGGMRGRGASRGRGGRGLGIPPYGYVCHRCSIPGHYIEDCPTNGDPAYDFKRVRYPTGIPSSMLEKDDQGGLLMPNGERARLKPNRKKFEEEMAGVPKPDRYQNIGQSSIEENAGKEIVVANGEGESASKGQGFVEQDKPDEGEKPPSTQEQGTVESGRVTEDGSHGPWNTIMSLPSFVDPFGVMFPMVRNDLPDASLSQLRKAFFEGQPIPEGDFQKFCEDHNSELTMRDPSNKREESVGTVERGRSPPQPPKINEPMMRERSRSPERIYKSHGPPPHVLHHPEYNYHGDFGPVRPPPSRPYIRPWGPEARHWQPPLYHEPEWFGYAGDGPYPPEPYRPPIPYMHQDHFPPYPEMYNRDYLPPRISPYNNRDGVRREYWEEAGEPRYDRFDYNRRPMHHSGFNRNEGAPFHRPPFEHNRPRREAFPTLSGDRRISPRYHCHRPPSPEDVRSTQMQRQGGDMRNSLHMVHNDDTVLSRQDSPHRLRSSPLPPPERRLENDRRKKHNGERNHSHDYSRDSSDKSAGVKMEESERLLKPAFEGQRKKVDDHLADVRTPVRSRSEEYRDIYEREPRLQWSRDGETSPRAAAHETHEAGRDQHVKGSPASHHSKGHRGNPSGWENRNSNGDRQHSHGFLEECKRKQVDLREILQDNLARQHSARGTLAVQDDRSNQKDISPYGCDEEHDKRPEETLPQSSKRSRAVEAYYEDPSHERSPSSPRNSSDDRNWRRNCSLDQDRKTMQPQIKRFEAESPIQEQFSERETEGAGRPDERWELDGNLEEIPRDDTQTGLDNSYEREDFGRHKHRPVGGKRKKTGKKRHREESKGKSRRSEKKLKTKRSRDTHETKDHKTVKIKREVLVD